MIPHGTANGYVHHRCRCDLCHEAKKARDAQYRAANRARRNAQAKEYYRTHVKGRIRALEDEEMLLRDALEHVWGSLPMSEIVLLPQRVRDVCISNHTRLEHPEMT